jgi:hypothetical protein
MASFQPGLAASPSVQVEISVQCSGLRDRDLTSKSDPTCVLFTPLMGEWTEFARTEKIVDNINPRWQTKFVTDYRFEERQMLRFKIYDIDSSRSKLSDHDSLGEMECSLGEVVALQSKGFHRELGKGKGKILLQVEEVSPSRETVFLTFEAKKLDNKDTFGKSDPFLEISRANDNSEFSLVHRTEVVDNNLSPTWRPIVKEVRALCNGDYRRTLKFEVFDDDSGGDHDIIGSFETNLQRLLKGPGSENAYDVINEKKRKKKGSKYTNSGTVMLKSIRVETNPTFLDFLQGGLQVNFTVAVDFTGSNGNPSHPDSLHYRDPQGRPNHYVTAIRSVGEIVQDYDSDKMFPALGFGARIPPNLEVSHEFFLTLDPSLPFCAGVEGVLAAYYNSLNIVQLYGPTNFSPVINHVANFASAHQHEPSNYFVLLIITDGIITDFKETKEALITASSLPMSVIIVGVGEEDFSAMEVLDGDKGGLEHRGKKAQRDIVQFVELGKYLTGSREEGGTNEALARAVLAEVPGQVTAWMKVRGFQPAVRG